MSYTTEIPDIGVFTHRWSGYLERCLGSIAKHTKGSYNVIVVCEPGNCHENMQRVIDRSQSRFICFVDEDVEFIYDGWLDSLIETVKENDEVAIVGALECKTPNVKKPYFPKEQRYQPVCYVGAFCMLIDREKMPDVYADLDIPCQKCFTDTDICFQAVSKGYSVVIDKTVPVFHNQRKYLSNDQWRKLQLPTAEQVAFESKPAIEYMKQKWGPFWEEIKQKNRTMVDRKAWNDMSYSMLKENAHR